MEPVLIGAAALAVVALLMSKKKPPSGGGANGTSWLLWSTDGGVRDGKGASLAVYVLGKLRLSTAVSIEAAAEQARTYGDPWLGSVLSAIAQKAANPKIAASTPGAPAEGSRWTQELAAVLLTQTESPEPVVGWNSNRLRAFSSAYSSVGLSSTANALTVKAALLESGQAAITPASLPIPSLSLPPATGSGYPQSGTANPGAAGAPSSSGATGPRDEDAAIMVAQALASRNPAIMRQTAALLRTMGKPEQAYRLEQEADRLERSGGAPPDAVPSFPVPQLPVPVPVPVLTPPAPSRPVPSLPPASTVPQWPSLPPTDTVPSSNQGPSLPSGAQESQALTDHLRTAKRGTENTGLVLAYQRNRGLSQDGKYGNSVGKAIAEDGVVPVKPYYWSAKDTQGALNSWNAAMEAAASRFPAKASGFRAAKANWNDVAASSGAKSTKSAPKPVSSAKVTKPKALPAKR